MSHSFRSFARVHIAAVAIGLVTFAAAAVAQHTPLADSVLVRSLAFRSIGPASMGGRIVDIAVAENPPVVRGGRLGTVLYVAAATGGIYKSTNAGINWTPVFDSVRTGSIGAVAVAPSNSEIVWVGTGESNNMRSSSWGTGVYKSDDGGKTWSGPMLAKSQHIGKIVVDPRDPNVVYVAAMGPLWASGGERGLFKTTDGGKTWTNTKNISANTGFTELVMDPSNPDVLYAASLERERREYGFLPAGPESAIWKTRDAGRTWTELAGGLPKGDLGRTGLAICRSKPSTVYAMVHAKAPANGLYRSDDSGSTWHLVNTVNGTAWYYSQVRCDPSDPEHVISLNAASRESFDGGRTWTNFANGGVHSDSHVLWINPEDPEQMILGNDGGLYTTFDRGRTWSHTENMVAAQFYAIAVDDAQPFYSVYGGLQDNQQWGGPSRSRNTFGPTNADWFRMHGGDGFYAVPDPWDYNLVYAEMQGGGVVRYDQRTGQAKNIKPVPKDGDKQRFNWSAPILPSRHDAKTVYMAANYLYRSPDRGDSWVTISPDLTRGIDRNKLPMRGAVPDSTALGRNEGTAEFSNISTIDESPLKAGVLVVGTDDGLIQVTRDGGKTWTKTDHFPGVPDTTYVSRVTFSRASEGTIYATLDGHRSNDFKPYVMKSSDYGKTWTSIASNLPDEGSVQVVREHPRQPNLLFVGTEFGVFFTIDGGAQWTQLKSGIPGVPVADLQIQPRWDDLVVGTHGRGVYILDNLAPLEHLAQAKQAQVAFMFPIRDELDFQPNATRSSGMGTSGFTGQNPELGAGIAYTLNDVPAGAKANIQIVDATGTVIRQIAAANKPGLYRQYWDMRAGPPLTGAVTDTLPFGTPVAAGRGGRAGGGG
ncbi:MAG: WD40/YVTN/BNR-like repeat-containing protein, partial [Gemmatimonadales bacterium]